MTTYTVCFKSKFSGVKSTIYEGQSVAEVAILLDPRYGFRPTNGFVQRDGDGELVAWIKPEGVDWKIDIGAKLSN